MSFLNRIVDTLIENVGVLHVIRKVADLDIGSDELLWTVIRNAINGDAGIIVNGAGDAVMEAFIEPFAGFGLLHMTLRIEIAVQWGLAGSGMYGSVMLPDVSAKALVELFQRVDLREVQDIEPPHLQGSEVPLDLSLSGPVSV